MATGIRVPPNILPPDREGYSDTYESTRSNVPMEIGPARVRNRMRAAPRIFNIKWTLSQEVYSIFDIWWQETILGGDLEFDIQLLDDTDTLVWFTVRWIEGTYKAEISEAGKWSVTGAIRTISDSFATRPAGTDELNGRSKPGIVAKGFLQIAVALHGRASIDLDTIAAPRNMPFYGRSYLKLSKANGRLTPKPFYGRTVFDLDALGQLGLFGDVELILQFDAVAYTADDGSSVELQFDAVTYYPPHIV